MKNVHMIFLFYYYYLFLLFLFYNYNFIEWNIFCSRCKNTWVFVEKKIKKVQNTWVFDEKINKKGFTSHKTTSYPISVEYLRFRQNQYSWIQKFVYKRLDLLLIIFTALERFNLRREICCRLISNSKEYHRIYSYKYFPVYKGIWSKENCQILHLIMNQT